MQRLVARVDEHLARGHEVDHLDDTGGVAQELVDARPRVALHVEENEGPVLSSGDDASALVEENESGEEGAPKDGRSAGGERPQRSYGA